MLHIFNCNLILPLNMFTNLLFTNFKVMFNVCFELYFLLCRNLFMSGEWIDRIDGFVCSCNLENKKTHAHSSVNNPLLKLYFEKITSYDGNLSNLNQFLSDFVIKNFQHVISIQINKIRYHFSM